MHKKNSKLSQRELRHSSTSRRSHLKNRDTDEGNLEVLKAPQNSRNELNKKIDFGNEEIQEKLKSNKGKRKHKSQETKSNERNNKKKSVHNIQDVSLVKESVKHKEKKEKRDKERLNKIEKYLEGLHKVSSKILLHGRSLSLDSSKALLENQDKHVRREKTFHDKASKDVSTNSHLNILHSKHQSNEKSRTRKKHRHKENKNRETSKDKNTKDNQQPVLYCEIEHQSPFLQETNKYNVERLYPEASKETYSRKRSSSRDNSVPSRLEQTLTSRKDKIKRSKDKNTPVKFSARRSKLKVDLRSLNNQKSNASLGPYGKYFTFDRTSQNEKETTRKKKKKRKKDDSTTKLSRNQKKTGSKEENIKIEKVKDSQEKTASNPDHYKVRIEDDIKSYFSKIQTLIDKKLDFILGSGANAKDTKSNLLEKDNNTHKTKGSKDKRVEKHDRNHQRKERKRSEEEEKQGRQFEEEARTKHFDDEKKTVRESRRVKDTEATNVCLKRERYPSEDSRYCRRSHSPQPPKHHHEHRSLSPPKYKRGSDTEVKHHKRHTTPNTRYSSHRMNPDHLIKMLEHPSTFSVKSSTSLSKKRLEEMKRRSNDIQTVSNEAEHYKKRDRSLSKRNTPTHEDNLKVEDLEKLHMQEVRKLKKRVATTQSNTALSKEKPDDVYSELNGKSHRNKKDGRCALPGEDDFDEMDLLEATKKKTKKRMRQLNLECKTVSIVGIPSQIRESAIFNETQTTTSLNVINPAEDSVEQKKKSKRFKLYYKYSVADNKCLHESDKSSEEMRSIVSDSYRVVSDPSDHNIDVWEDKDAHKDSDSDLSKILFIMKNEKANKTKKYRKRGASPKPATLNNIVEEPSNISIVIRPRENKSLLKKDLNCTFFKSLRSSSSGCNLDPIKHSRKDPNKRKSRNPCKENSVKSKSSREKSTEQENKKYEETHRYSKHVPAESHNGVKKRNKNTNYASKSDINISYDSLKNRKTTKPKYKDDGPSHFREQLRQILPDIIFRKSSPDRKSIDMIIKEEIREIIREIPRKVIRELSFAEKPDKIVGKLDSHQSDLKKPNETKKQDAAEQTYSSDKINDTHEEVSNEKNEIQDAEDGYHEQDSKECNYNPSIQNIEEDSSKKVTDSLEMDSRIEDTGDKTYCSKKIGTNQAVTRIPSLIKGYTSMTSSEMKGESMEVHNVADHDNPEESDHMVEELGKNNLVDATTEINASGDIADKAMIILENKKSQTPSYLDTPTVVTICDATKQYQYSKKVATTNNLKRCKIIDPFLDGKIGSVSKITRPIINLENSQFPGHKPDKSATPASEQYKREKSNLSEVKTVKFESLEKLEPRRLSERRPATAGEKRKNSPSDKFRQKSMKPALTMSTNIAVVDTSTWAERPGTYDTQAKRSRKDFKNHPDQGKPSGRYTVTTFKSQIQSNLPSKSSMSLSNADVESKIGSLVYVDKYNQKINLNSNSNPRSLDTYATKCLINDNPHPSKLFLTKSFDPKLNTYQRRKMYDESIRKKMKKKFGTKSEMGPRIFEVRYLTLESPSLQEQFDINNSSTPIINQKCISRLPTYNIKTNKVKLRSRSCKLSIKKSRRFPKNKEDACKFSGRDIFAPVISDVDQLNKFRRKTFPEKKVEEIFVKDRSLTEKASASDREQNSSIALKNNEQICKMDQGNSEYVHQNFKTLVDQLYNSIISYCDTKFKLPQESSPGPTQIVKDKQNVSKSPVDEKSYIIFPRPSNETISTLNESFKKNSCSEGNVTAEEKEMRPSNLICSHLSCPVLAGSTSSFDYLYEDGPIEINKDAVLLHFKKPMKTILGYALNNTHRVQKETFRHLRKGFRVPNSVSESEESGYSSNNSKKCASVCSFFKKPSIINLFKPVRKLETEMSTSTLNDCRSGPNLQEYSVMNQKCIEYAEKVRSQCENNQEPVETFREIPLDVLLLCRKSYTFLGDFNSNCSLCKKHSTPELPNITEGDELSNKMDNLDHLMEDSSFTEEDKHTDALQEGNIQKETLVFYEDVGCKHSLELVALQKSHTSFTVDDTSQLMKEIAQCPVVLSITNLNSCSLTIVEEPNANKTSFCFDNIQKEGVRSIDLNLVNLDPCNFKESHVSKSSIHTELDGKSDIFFGIGARHSNTPSAASKFMAKRFFENLLKVYEKEIDMTNKLFQDDHFFVNVLLESVKSGKVPKPKNKLKKFIKDKIKNIFFPKNYVDNGCVNIKETSNSNNNQRKLQSLAGDARKYFCMFVQAVKSNKDINDEIKICGLLKLLERIEDGDFAILREKEEVDFEEEIKKQVKEAFMNIYQMSVKEARKYKRSLTTDDLKLIRTFVSKYRIGMLSKTDLIATYIGRGVFKTEGHLKAAVNYLIRQNKAKDVDLKDFDEHCKILSKC